MKTAILMCTCSAACPSMEKVNFWELAERLRLEVPQDFMLLHPRLCEENGEALMEDLLKSDTVYITAACAEKKQSKLLGNGFRRSGIPMDDQHWVPIVMSLKDTDTVLEDIKSAIERMGSSGQ